MPSTSLTPLLHTPSAKRARRRLSRSLRRYRRPLAAGLIVLALASAIRPVAEARGVTSWAVVVTRDLAAGDVITHADVTTREVPVDVLPSDGIATIDDVVGSRLAMAASANEVLTPRRLVAGRGSLPLGYVMAPVRITDTQVAAMIRVGDVVDVLAAPPSGALGLQDRTAAWTVAAGARVVGTSATSGATGSRGSLFGSSSSASLDGGGLVLLSVPSATAARLAGAASTSRLSLTLLPDA